MKSNPIMNAGLIGLMIGIVIYSAINDSLGFFTLIPLFFIYRMLNDSEDDKVAGGK